MNLGNRGRFAAVGAWMERGARLAADSPTSVVHGYLAVPQARRAAFDGDARQALTCAELAATVAAEVGDRDLAALARFGQSVALVMLGETAAGLAVLDDVMLDASSGGPSALVIGIVYCAVVGLCRQALDLRRAREWTYALDRWCERQPELVTFRGECRVHRSQVLLEADDWDHALTEAENAVTALSHPRRPGLGAAWYQKAEVLRLRGELTAAQDAYGTATRQVPTRCRSRARRGWGWAGRATPTTHVGAARRPGPPAAGLLAAAVDVALAAGDVQLPGGRRRLARRGQVGRRALC